MHAKLLQLCLTLRNPMYHSLPGSSVHGILQVRTLEWVAMPSIEKEQTSRDGMVRLSCPTSCKQWSCNSWGQYKLELGKIWPQLTSVLPQCHQSIFMAVNPGSLPEVQPSKPEPLQPSPTLHSGHEHVSLFSAGKCCCAWSLCEVSPFSLLSMCCFAALWGSKLNPPVRGFPSVWTFLLQYSLPGGAGPQPDSLCVPFCL